jgi:hypothetical protein
MKHSALRADDRPRMVVTVDTEEEFDWGRGFSRDNVSVSAIAGQAAAHERIYDRLGVVPTYVIDHPVATDEKAVRLLSSLRDAGKAEIGAHLHPWVNPPHEEKVSVRNSYQCNLPPELERRKIEALTDAIEASFGARPTVFKAGRHGFGENTQAVLAELGYKVDCSFVPHTSFTSDGGPSFHGAADEPFWLDRERRLLEVPTTAGFFGAGAAVGPRLASLFDSHTAASLRIPGLLGKSGLLTRSRLTPEGVSAGEQCRLLDARVKAGQRTFNLVYHSPSLAPGHTPYVRDKEELTAFLEAVLSYFRDELGGRFTALRALHAEMEAESFAAA